MCVYGATVYQSLGALLYTRCPLQQNQCHQNVRLVYYTVSPSFQLVCLGGYLGNGNGDGTDHRRPKTDRLPTNVNVRDRLREIGLRSIFHCRHRPIRLLFPLLLGIPHTQIRTDHHPPPIPNMCPTSVSWINFLRGGAGELYSDFISCVLLFFASARRCWAGLIELGSYRLPAERNEKLLALIAFGFRENVPDADWLYFNLDWNNGPNLSSRKSFVEADRTKRRGSLGIYRDTSSNGLIRYREF